MPVSVRALPHGTAELAERRAAVARQLDLLLDVRGPVTEVRRLLDDLDRISADLARSLGRAGTTEHLPSR